MLSFLKETLVLSKTCKFQVASGLNICTFQKSLVTATTTRRKQQQEMIYKALLAEEERKKIGRENFPMTTISPTQQAAYEPALHHVNEDHEEGRWKGDEKLPYHKSPPNPSLPTSPPAPLPQ